jgi:hypothetical protein
LREGARSASRRPTTAASSPSPSSSASAPTGPPIVTAGTAGTTTFSSPANYGGGTITVRLHGNEEDAQRRFNRTENVRPIALTDPDLGRLFRIRNDAESIKRGLEDTLYLRRAHSVGHHRQLVNLLGWALVINSVALHEHLSRTAARLPPDQPGPRTTQRSPLQRAR